MLMDVSQQKTSEIELARLAAIVASSDDAIVSKTLDGRVTSWNAGATHMFGYKPEEIIGKPINLIIPPEFQKEEYDILARLRRGERIDHYDAVRVAKDGRRVNVSLTVSPLRDKAGTIVGASKIARDVTERKEKEELQRILFQELNHRVKNTLAVVQAIASQSLKRTPTPEEFVKSFSGRIQALARTHDLLVLGKMKGADVATLIRQELSIYILDAERISYSGPSVMLGAKTTGELALILHELATNARKFGALSIPTGKLSIAWKLRSGGRELALEWKESGVPKSREPIARGFGTSLIERSLTNGGTASVKYSSDGVICRIRLRVHEQIPSSDAFELTAGNDAQSTSQSIDASNLREKRILLIEDEPLIAMEIAALLESEGFEIIGPARTLESARSLIADSNFDAALVDANLAGNPVGELVTALKRKHIPFAFATGYGRDALPIEFRDAPMLTKPFSASELFAGVRKLFLDGCEAPAKLTPV